ncbi:uncharacterized protein F54H12.2 [Trichonephila clavipes]|nr:uncharacterized protein F54H12.2 [Trichonephila clavipes]
MRERALVYLMLMICLPLILCNCQPKKVRLPKFSVASLSDKTPIEFFFSGVGDSYLDLAHTLLHLQSENYEKKKSGSNIGTPDVVAPVNYLLNTLFSECSVTLNDKQVSSQANYAYRCMFDALLSPKSVQESLLTAGLFFRDSPGKMDATEIRMKPHSRGVIKMPIRRTEVKSFHAFFPGMQSIIIPNAFIGQVPARLIMDGNRRIPQNLSTKIRYLLTVIEDVMSLCRA